MVVCTGVGGVTCGDGGKWEDFDDIKDKLARVWQLIGYGDWSRKKQHPILDGGPCGWRCHSLKWDSGKNEDGPGSSSSGLEAIVAKRLLSEPGHRRTQCPRSIHLDLASEPIDLEPSLWKLSQGGAQLTPRGIVPTDFVLFSQSPTVK